MIKKRFIQYIVLPFKSASLLLQSSDLAASKIVFFTIYKGKIAQKSGVAPLLTKYILENQSLQFKNNPKVQKLKVIKNWNLPFRLNAYVVKLFCGYPITKAKRI